MASVSAPLEGIRVVDLTRVTPGGYCTLLLSDLGAEVIKVEDIREGDYGRFLEPKKDGVGLRHLVYNRDKKSVALNLKHEQGVEAYLRLVDTADVVVEGFRPGVADRLGIGYATLKQRQPRLVYCAYSSFGQDGPFAALAGHDINLVALGGFLDLNQGPSGPVMPGVSLADMGTGRIAAIAILAALLARARTGEGQFIDVSMLDGIVSLMASPATHPLGGLAIPDDWQGSPRNPLYRTYETADGRFVALGVVERPFWERFCAAVERADLLDAPDADEQRRQQVVVELEKLIAERTFAQWSDLFAREDLCCSPVLTLGEALQHPQVRHRSLVFEVEHPAIGTVGQIGLPFRMSGTPGRADHQLAPDLGEHTGEILATLGYADGDVAGMRDAGAIR